MGCLGQKSTSTNSSTNADNNGGNIDEKNSKIDNNGNIKVKNKEVMINKIQTYDSGKKVENNNPENLRLNVLSKHNELRKKHNSPELILNEKLNEMAQEYAKILLEKNNKQNNHINLYNNKICGENIFLSIEKTPEDMFNKWVKEADYFNFNLHQYQKDSGHFTQMIWKETKEVGFGFEFTEDKKFCGVALYFPCGNVLGEFKNNIESSK